MTTIGAWSMSDDRQFGQRIRRPVGFDGAKNSKRLRQRNVIEGFETLDLEVQQVPPAVAIASPSTAAMQTNGLEQVMPKPLRNLAIGIAARDLLFVDFEGHMDGLIGATNPHDNAIDAAVLTYGQERFSRVLPTRKTDDGRAFLSFLKKPDSIILAKQSVDSRVCTHSLAGPFAPTHGDHALPDLRKRLAIDPGHQDRAACFKAREVHICTFTEHVSKMSHVLGETRHRDRRRAIGIDHKAIFRALATRL